MIAVDTSSWIAYLSGEKGKDVEILELALEQKQVVLSLPVLTELLSDPQRTEEECQLFLNLPQLSLTDGYWKRAGALRKKLLSKKYKARLADALIAQNCIDHKMSLLTRDRDFRHFEKVGGLKLLAI